MNSTKRARNQGEQIRNFHVGRLRVEERLLAMVVTKITGGNVGQPGPFRHGPHKGWPALPRTLYAGWPTFFKFFF